MADRVDVGAIRRAQIVEAATRVIARKGFHNATLAEVESEARISRGMMTYHFPTKDAMILAVFDSLIDRLRLDPDRPSVPRGPGRLHRLIDALLVENPPDAEAQSLLYTFLAQISHRDDYRDRLAAHFASLRDDLSEEFPGAAGRDEARSLAAILVATLHGLTFQILADPGRLEPTRLASTLKRLLASIDLDRRPDQASGDQTV